MSKKASNTEGAEQRQDCDEERDDDAIKTSLVRLQAELSRVSKENSQLRQKLEEAHTKTKFSNPSAVKIFNTNEVLREPNQTEIYDRKAELGRIKKEEAWVLLVESLVESRAEQVTILSQTFDQVVNLMENSEARQEYQKMRWFQNDGMGAAEDTNLRQNVMKKHAQLFKNRMEQLQRDTLNDSRSLKQMRESLSNDCSRLEADIELGSKAVPLSRRARGVLIEI